MNLQEEAKKFIAQYSQFNIAADKPKGTSKKFTEIYYAIFEELPKCASCNSITEAFSKFKTYSITGINPKDMNKSNYKLKEGQMLYCREHHCYVSNANLTDELAVSLINEGVPLSLFDFIPTENIRVTVSNVTTTDTKVTTVTEVEEGRSIVNKEQTTELTEKVVEEPKKEFVFEIKDHSKKKAVKKGK